MHQRLAGVTCTVALAALTGCWQADSGNLEGAEAVPPSDFRSVGRSSPCFLEVGEPTRSVRVNCFHIDGVLHVHSNRFSKFPRLVGESWVDTVVRIPTVRISISDRIYRMTGTIIDDEQRRRSILDARGYWYPWDGIRVFSFSPRDS